MKKYLSLFLILLTFKNSHGQKFSIAADKMNILYVGVDNPITIAVENSSNKSIIIKTNNGKITGNNGSYTFRSNEVGKAEISIYKKIK